MHVLGLFQPLKTLWQCTQHFSFQSADKVERFGSRTEKYPIWRLASNWCSNVETKALHRKKECCSTTFTLYTLKHMQQLCSTYTTVHTVLKRRKKYLMKIHSNRICYDEIDAENEAFFIFNCFHTVSWNLHFNVNNVMPNLITMNFHQKLTTMFQISVRMK